MKKKGLRRKIKHSLMVAVTPLIIAGAGSAVLAQGMGGGGMSMGSGMRHAHSDVFYNHYGFINGALILYRSGDEKIFTSSKNIKYAFVHNNKGEITDVARDLTQEEKIALCKFAKVNKLYISDSTAKWFGGSGIGNPTSCLSRDHGKGGR